MSTKEDSKIDTNRQKTGGRQKGTPNKTTNDVRKAIALFAENNVHKLEEWLDDVSRDNPAKAAEIYLRVLEYHIPKLSRAELSGNNGEALKIEVVCFADTE